MKFSTDAIVSNTDMMKNYKACRDKAEALPKIFIMKNNEPDAVLFSISAYEKLSKLIETAEQLEEDDIARILEALPNSGDIKKYSMGLIRKDIDQIIAVDIIK
jgi:prevent-host-death family protein